MDCPILMQKHDYSKIHNYIYISEVRKPRQQRWCGDCSLKCEHIFGFYYNERNQFWNYKSNEKPSE